MKFCGVTIFLIFSLSSLEAFTSESLKVKLDHGGVLVGRHYETVNGRHIRAFLGIPYAKPPLGDLRFKSPETFPKWTGHLKAIEKKAMCLHISPFLGSNKVEGDEDCLYLYVYTPPLEYVNSSGLLPVMVWFHGGAWESGSGDDSYYGPQYLLDRNIVLVSANYRLGPLGFLSTESEDCPGNFALKDQVEVLKWVQKNIKAFGGNPNSVTVFGESAGSASVSYHMNSHLSEGLFHKAILQSGTLFNPWAQPFHKGKARANALKLASFFQCESEREMIECLRKVSGPDLMNTFNEFFLKGNQPAIQFRPVVESKQSQSFLYEHPRETGLKSLDIPIMIGITTGEGLLISVPILANENMLKEYKDDKNKRLPLILNYDHLKLKRQQEITMAIEKYYLKNGHDYDKNNYQNFTDLHSDALFNMGVDEYLNKRLAQISAPTYVYVYDHKTVASLTEIIHGGEQYFGVCHADDLLMLFPIANTLFPTSIPSEKDIIMRNALLDMWVNFATFGNPTPPGESLPKWRPAEKYPWNYARIGSQDPKNWYILQNEDKYILDRVAFWRTLGAHDDVSNRANREREEL